MALTSQQIKDMQSWYGAKADGIWGKNSTTAAGGRDAGSAYSLYSSNKGRYSSYTNYMSYGGGRNTGTSGGTQSSGINANTIKEMQKWYGTTADGIWGSNSTTAAGGRNVNDAYKYWKSNSRYGSYSDFQGKSQSGSSGTSGGSGSYTPSGSGFYNGGLSDSQIKEMQNYYGVTADGMWGSKSSSAAGGLSAADAWNAYQESLSGQGYGDYGYDSGYDYSGPMSYADYLQRVGGDDYQAAVQKAIEAQVQAQYASYLQNERSIQAEIDMFNRQLAAQQAQEAAQPHSSGDGDDESAGGLSNYTAVKNNILNYATHGVVGHAKTLLQNVWGQMSTSQQQDMVNALKRLGIAT